MIQQVLPQPASTKFVPTQYTYTGSVAANIVSVQLTPTLQDAAAKITVDATVTLNGVISNFPVTVAGSTYTVGLSSGTITININISPAFGNMKGVYTLTITRT